MKASTSQEPAFRASPDSGNPEAPASVPAAYWLMVKRASIAWIDDGAPSMGAALAFYSAFSLAPLLVIVIAVAGALFGVDSTRNAVMQQFADLLGPAGADAIARLLQSAAVDGSGVLATIVSSVLLL